MSKLWQQLLNIWSRLEISQKATIVLATLGCIALAAFLLYGATRTDYRLLVADLPKAKVAEIVAYLDQNHVSYQLTDRDSAILVPSKDLYKLRNELAQREMLGDGSKGFELLEKTGMFESTYREHRTYDRAVAGELERSLKEITGVDSARVLIDRPQPSPFVDDDAAKPKASVKLGMRQGVRLTDRQISGIIHLTAGAVAGLSPERVEIMDGSGRLTPEPADSNAAKASTALEAEMAREAYLTRKAQEQLDTVLGPGRSRVKVSVKMDFTKRAESSNDPIVSAKAVTETSQTTDEKNPVPGTGGVTGTASNVEGDGRPTAQPPAIGSKTMEKTESKFAVGSKTTTTEDEVGRINGMNVSILLDYKATKVEKKDKDGKPTGEFEEKREEFATGDRKRFEELVLNAIGFNAAKDITAKIDPKADIAARFTSTVQSMELYREPVDPVAIAKANATIIPDVLTNTFSDERSRWWIGFGLTALIAGAFLVYANGQLKRSHSAVIEAERRAREASEAEVKKNAPPEPPPGEGGEEDDMAKALRVRRDSLKESVKKKIADDPVAAAQLLRAWLHEG